MVLCLPTLLLSLMSITRGVFWVEVSLPEGSSRWVTSGRDHLGLSGSVRRYDCLLVCGLADLGLILDDLGLFVEFISDRGFVITKARAWFLPDFVLTRLALTATAIYFFNTFDAYFRLRPLLLFL